MRDKLINLLLPISWILILISCFFIFAFTSKAASSSNTEIPYIVPNWRNANSCIPDEAIQSAEIRYIYDVRNYFGYQGDLSYICFVQDGLINNGSLYQIFFITNPTITDSYIDNYDFYNGTINVNSNNIAIIACNVRASDYVTISDAINLGWSASLCGNSATTTVYGGNLTPRYPFYMVGTDEIKSANDKVIFTNIAPVVIPTGHATAPDNFEDPVYNTGHAKPTSVPQLTINNYTWTTPPTPDFSTLENTAKSIFDILQWLSNNLIGEFSNLINNIQNVGNYIGSTIQYYGNLIISTIQNGITTFYNNMVSLFEPIASAINYISQPVSGTVIYDNISGTSLIQSINTVDTALTTFQGTFTGLSEPNSFVIPIHLENLPSSWFGTQTTQYLDLSWINSDMRTLIRVFMWAIITYALFITIVDSIANYINGGGDES